MNTPCKMRIASESWPIAGRFVISRGARTEAKVVTVTLEAKGRIGRGECVPYARYGETVESVIEQLTELKNEIEDGLDRLTLQTRLAAGAARNAIDCALWDIEAKLSSKRVHELAAIKKPSPIETAYTISLASPEEMAAACERAKERKVLKIKLGGDDDLSRMQAVRHAAPEARLILDANESWSSANLEAMLHAANKIGAAVVEQPLPSDNDICLEEIARPVPVCADESLHTRHDLERLRMRYDCINIKLDKAGGLTEALVLKQDALNLGFSIMVGCMVGTSLAMAPAMLLSEGAEFVDLDGPLLLARDRRPGLTYEGSMIYPPEPDLWG